MRGAVTCGWIRIPIPKIQSSSKTHLVDEQYDLPLAVLDPVDYLLQPLLELPAVACARDERAHVETDQPAVPQRVGHVAGVYPLGDPLGDGGLACTRRDAAKMGGNKRSQHHHVVYGNIMYHAMVGRGEHSTRDGQNATECQARQNSNCDANIVHITRATTNPPPPQHECRRWFRRHVSSASNAHLILTRRTALTDARIPDEHRIVLGPPAEYLYRPPDLVVPPNDRIELPQRRPLREVDPELVEGIVVVDVPRRRGRRRGGGGGGQAEEEAATPMPQRRRRRRRY